MNKYRHTYPLKDDLLLYGAFWPTIRKKANVVIVTGMEEHALRYTDFATFLNHHDYNVYAVDFYGQGENITKGGHVKGQVPDQAFSTFVDHLAYLITDILNEDLPIYVIGHSMGSFLSQHLIARYPRLVHKVVIVGSNGPSILFGLGNLVAAITVTKRNRDKESKLLASLSIGSYAKAIKNARTGADWLSYDENNVHAFLASPLDGGPSSKGFYRELLRGTSSLYRRNNFRLVPRELPMYFIAGEDDPVGAFGKGVKKLHNFYVKGGFTKTDLKLYPHMRHEILNETKKEQVYNDILKFLEE